MLFHPLFLEGLAMDDSADHKQRLTAVIHFLIAACILGLMFVMVISNS